MYREEDVGGVEHEAGHRLLREGLAAGEAVFKVTVVLELLMLVVGRITSTLHSLLIFFLWLPVRHFPLLVTRSIKKIYVLKVTKLLVYIL